MFTTQYQPTHLNSVRGHYLIRLNYIYEHKRQVKGSVPTTREHITREAHRPSPQLTDSRVGRSEQPPPPTRNGAPPLRPRRGMPRPLWSSASGQAAASGEGTRPFPGQPRRPPILGHRQPRQRRRKSGRGSAAARRGRGGSAGLGRRSSAVSTETPARAELATQRGPAGARNILGGRGRNAAGPGGGGDPGNLYSQPTARLSRTPRRRLPVPRLTATARRGTAAPGRGWLGAGFSARGSTAGEGRRAAPHLRSAEGARGKARTWRRRAGARVPRWGAGSGRRPSRTGCHYFARGGAGGWLGRGRQAPPAGRLHSGNRVPPAFPSRRHHVTSSGGGGKGRPLPAPASPALLRGAENGSLPVPRRG